MASTTLFKILALVCFIQVTFAWRKFNDLRVKTNAFGIPKHDAFFRIPKTTSSHHIHDFVKVQPESGFRFQMEFYCRPNDPRVCFMYDKKGNVVGAQISILKSDISHIQPEHYNYAAIKEFTPTNFFNIPAYSMRMYFTNPETLTAAGRGNTDETAEGLWTYLDGKLVEIQRSQPTGPKMGDFDKQGCYPAMGQHYIYKHNKDSSCKDHFSLFPLYEQGGLVGYGFSAPAKSSKFRTDWYEIPTAEAIKVIVPNPPKCSVTDGQNYGWVSLHVFLVDKPWDISCPK